MHTCKVGNTAERIAKTDQRRLTSPCPQEPIFDFEHGFTGIRILPCNQSRLARAPWWNLKYDK